MNYASKSGWSSIKEMNSPCNLISYGSLLCWAAESNCPWKEIYLQYMLAIWNGIAFWRHSNGNNTPPPPAAPLLRVAHPCFSPLVFQLQARSASEEDPECDITREPTHHAPLSPRPHVPRHDPSNRYGLAFGLFSAIVTKPLMIHSVWVFSIALLLSVTHTCTHSYAHMHSFPHQWPPRSLSSKWQPVQSDTCTQPPDTNCSLVYQKQILSSIPGNQEGENKLKWRSFLSDYSSRCYILPKVHSN